MPHNQFERIARFTAAGGILPVSLPVLGDQEYRGLIKNQEAFVNEDISGLARRAGRLIAENPIIHPGCGTIRINGAVNVDALPTPAADIVYPCADLKIFPDNCADCVYSNAFFEHLFSFQCLPFLEDVFRVLRESGVVFFTAIPDFEAIAGYYLQKREGNLSQVFDIREVYRYLYGEENISRFVSLEGLHKSLHDASSLDVLLKDAGFGSRTIFRYAFGIEPLDVNLGFLASKAGTIFDRARIIAFGEVFRSSGINPASVRILRSS